MKPILLPFIFIIGLNACNSGDLSPTYIPKFTPSENSLFKIDTTQEYTFGYLEVPENRAAPHSNTIKLPVYIFKSRNPMPKPDPIIYTVGGPGSSTMPSAPYMAYYRYLDDRDFILFEQRGTQYAQPHLDCPEWAEAVYLSNLPDVDTTQSDSLFEAAVTNCRKRLIDKGIDLNGYNTNESAADIADLRKVLGIDQYNLLTLSYSTKIAQVLLRDYPQGIRSVVMDSPLPLEVSYDEESVDNLLEAIEKLLADCGSDIECNKAFPDLKNRFFGYLARITKQPLEVNIENPNTGEQETFYLEGKDIISIFTAASTSDVPNIPLEIHQLLNGDLSSIKEQLAYIFEAPGAGNGQGMRLSVWCAEEHPFNAQETITTTTNKYPQTKGLSPAVFDSSVCTIWGVKVAAAMENKSVKSEVPVLLISGSYDNETPPKWAAAMQKNLPNSFHLMFKGWKHGPTTNWGNPCAMKTANAFFNAPANEPLLECFNTIKETRFKLE